jgi:endonuclease/exonuclease/phosphatase family metal-dependent hydrolase
MKTNHQNTDRPRRTVAVIILLTSIGATQVLADKYVTQVGSLDADGTQNRPFASVKAAACTLSPDESIFVEAGNYPDAMTINTRSRIIPTNGVVRIGDTGSTQTTLKIVTYNTHLFGDAVPNLPDLFPPVPLGLQWQEDLRADRIGDIALNENADIFCMQEVWDVDLKNRILNHSGSPYSFYGDRIDPETYDPPGPIGPTEVPAALNSGLLILSQHPLYSPVQISYTQEAEFIETLASKGFLFTRITKDGVTTAIINTHLQAYYESEQVAARAAQMAQLGAAIQNYRALHPDHAVIVTGDFNVIGETSEYVTAMAPLLGGVADSLDLVYNMHCVTPGAAQYTALFDNPLNVYFTQCTNPGHSLCTDACTLVGDTCETLCGETQDLCLTGCTVTHDACVGACTGVCVTADIIENCLIALPECSLECCGLDGCDNDCFEDCFAGCGVFDSCVDNCEFQCTQELSGCNQGCMLDCNNCQACTEACDAEFCELPEADGSARLDYILYAGSLDRTVDIIPTNYVLRDYQGPTELSEGGLETAYLSDHIAVMAEFQLVKR